MSKPILVVLGHFTEDVEARIARDYTVRRVSVEAPTQFQAPRTDTSRAHASGAEASRVEVARPDAPGGSAATFATTSAARSSASSAATSAASSAASSAANRLEELLLEAEGADAIFFNPVRLDAEFFRRVAASVKVIATFSVGYDHIDVGAAAARGIAIANTPGVLDDATADVAILLLLGASRRAYEAQELVRSGAWAKGNAPRLLGWDCAGKVLGIFGMGRIGQAVARRGRALGMKIHYSNRRALPAELAGDAVFHARAQDLLRVSQFLSLHAPHTAETHHFLDVENIALLPAGAIVINAARGGLVEDGALIAALKTGRVAAAGLDVFEGEPKINPGYVELRNTFLLPHIGSATLETNTAMGMLALDNIDAVLAGRVAPSLVKI
jgi:lactate dehydrogenase-like 2-hydroxyacid dehydrogenase